ncbi:MAG: hypothetical protein RIF39_16870 [Cyclobacteriaceae bacterium]
MAKNEIDLDRKVLLLLSNEIFVKGGTTENFQDKLYRFLDDCKAAKNEKEYLYLIGLLRKTMSNH